MFELNGKVALVTGASRGIGRAIALSLAKSGADVAVNDLIIDQAQEVAKEISELGRRSIAVRADVSNKAQVDSMVEIVIRDLGRIDVLVNNAGIISFEPFLNIEEITWDKMMSVNLKGPFLVAQAVARHMVQRGGGGKIINIAAGISGQTGINLPDISHYSASKGGVFSLTQAMAFELAPHCISVNAIAPGAVETDMMTKDEEVKQGALKRIPKGRFGKPEDIASMAVFLASDEADYCTGGTFYVTGGWLPTS